MQNQRLLVFEDVEAPRVTGTPSPPRAPMCKSERSAPMGLGLFMSR